MVVVRHLVWNPWNVAHIARHQVTPNEVEEVRKQPYLTRPSYKNRFAITGQASSGRMLTVVIDPQQKRGLFFPVTARSASRKERELYQKHIGGGEHK